MKLTYLTGATALLFLIELLSQPTSAVANPKPLTLEQAARFSRDLTSYPDFFQQGQEKLEREIERLYQRQNAPSETQLQINDNVRDELEQLPQIQQNNFEPQSQPE
ncbi:MAG TPA: hypothetical protein DDZ80_22120 [Cyanobacteria bacterium UBA8803]|nr:hypothetical protein [Cyanobacteria bacterium UBA9273]HBL61026.1 hypothetical protein [Cyanobacteria bacterium UBA8803]